MDMAENAPYPPDTEEAGEVSTAPVPRAKAVRKKVLATTRPKSKKPGAIHKRGNRILAQEKRRSALELRKAGVSYAEIAKAVGYADQSGARKAVMKAFGEVIQEPVAELRVIQQERLNHMLMALWPRVQQGDETAINTALRVMDKVDRLQGTEEAPANNGGGNMTVHTGDNILVIDGDKDDYIAALRKMSGAGVQADGTNEVVGGPPPGMEHRALNKADHEQMVDDGIIDADVVEDAPPGSLKEALGAEGVAAVQAVMAPPKEPKRFKFGMDPTVKREK